LNKIVFSFDAFKNVILFMCEAEFSALLLKESWKK